MCTMLSTNVFGLRLQWCTRAPSSNKNNTSLAATLKDFSVLSARREWSVRALLSWREIF